MSSMNRNPQPGNWSSFSRPHRDDVPRPLEPSIAKSQHILPASVNEKSPSARTSPLPPGAPPNTWFASRRKQKGEIEKPWLNEKNPRQIWLSLFPIIGVIVGFLATGALVWDGLREAKLPDYCQIMDEDFSGGLNPKIWTKESEVGGYGNGQFEETTSTNENVFIQDGMLIIRPSLQDEQLIYQNNVINLTKDGLCTAEGQPWQSCVTSTNTTNGTIVNPVKSARINTKGGASIKYGRLISTFPAAWSYLPMFY
jgi:hypothetical protein